MFRRTFLSIPALAILVSRGATADPALLSPEQAFKMALGPSSTDRVEIKFLSAPGYYLYADRFSFVADSEDVKILEVLLPPGARKYEAAFEHDVEYFRGMVTVTLRLSGPLVPFKLSVRAQGCADAGVCYPPVGKIFSVGRKNS